MKPVALPSALVRMKCRAYRALAMDLEVARVCELQAIVHDLGVMLARGQADPRGAVQVFRVVLQASDAERAKALYTKSGIALGTALDNAL